VVLWGGFECPIKFRFEEFGITGRKVNVFGSVGFASFNEEYFVVWVGQTSDWLRHNLPNLLL